MADHRRSLLLVEDDDTTREVLALLLTEAGWTVHAAGTGEEALLTLGSTVHLITALCDVNLPGLRGSELAAALHALSPSLDLLAMSATRLPAPPPGYRAMLLKPFGPAELDAALQAERVAATPAHTAPAQSAITAGETPDASTDELSILRLDTVLKLQGQMGTRARELYAFALADAGDRLDRLATAAHAGDEQRWHAEAHALKGSAGMIGAERLSRLAAAAESIESVAAADIREDRYHRSLGAMRLACDEIRLMLETLFPV